MQGWQETAHHYGLEQRHQGKTASGKNATDIALTVDAMDMLYSGAIQHFCLATSDSDYTPLVTRLRSAGCTVLVIGKPTTPLALKTACTAFIPRNAVAQLHVEWVPIPHLSAALKQLDPHFTAQTYGYKNLPALVQNATDLFRTRKRSLYRVVPDRFRWYLNERET